MPLPVASTEWTCPQCKQTFLLKPWETKTRRFCSRACLHASMRVANPVRKSQRAKPIYPDRPCEHCEEIYQPRSVIQKFCSQKCSVAAIHDRNIKRDVTERPCENCGKIFRPRPNVAGRFCSRECSFEGQSGPKASHWRGGKHITNQGYVKVYQPEHPSASGRGGYVQEHRLVMEKMLGRYLRPNENPHHKNGNRQDNRPENLELWVKPQQPGQRAEDLVAWAKEILATYEKDVLTLNAAKTVRKFRGLDEPDEPKC